MRIRAVVTAFPRPNQAFWTLSALWAGWLWGRDAVGPFKSVLRRRRYDWGWHSTALQAALEYLPPLIESGNPFFGLMGESEPGFLSAGVIAAEAAGFGLDGIALRPEESQAQVLWHARPVPIERNAAQSGSTDPGLAEEAAQAAQQYLLERAEPAAYTHIYSAALCAVTQSGALRAFRNPPSGVTIPPAETHTRINDLFEDAFSYRRGFLRFGGSQKSPEVGQWWLRENLLERQGEDSFIPLADRIEMALVNTLLKRPEINTLEMDASLCEDFPGLFTPGAELIQAGLDSYGQRGEHGGWRLRPFDAPNARRTDLKTSYKALKVIASRLGYRTKGRSPLLWIDASGETVMVWYVQASAVAGKTILANPYPPAISLIALPDVRANLLAYKMRKDPRLKQRILEGWRFINLRQLSWLADHPSLTIKNLEEQLTLDISEYDDPQMRML
jgi:hypothetical protein